MILTLTRCDENINIFTKKSEILTPASIKIGDIIFCDLYAIHSVYSQCLTHLVGKVQLKIFSIISLKIAYHMFDFRVMYSGYPNIKIRFIR